MNDTPSFACFGLEPHAQRRTNPRNNFRPPGLSDPGDGNHDLGRNLCRRTFSGGQPQPAVRRQPALPARQHGAARVSVDSAYPAGATNVPAMAATDFARVLRDFLLQPVLLLWPAVHQCFTGLVDCRVEPGRDRSGLMAAVQGAPGPGESRRYRDLHRRRRSGDCQPQPAITCRDTRCMDR
ncbi:hypothetical protein PMI25_000944 [Pseudomonas sp. GM30]|nr:hypothetical protein PMI25_000944 [Pseudomonas sp. GM30]